MKTLALLSLLLLSCIAAAGSTFEPYTDRMGSDYTSIEMGAPDPYLCQQACENDYKCRAWTYVRPHTIQGPIPLCWLKSAVPAPEGRGCCVSGVVDQGGPTGMEWDTDRMGLDYHSFQMSSADPALCRMACDDDARCRAWTFVHPHTIQGPYPLCWLKGGVPAPAKRSCCVSGVK